MSAPEERQTSIEVPIAIPADDPRFAHIAKAHFLVMEEVGGQAFTWQMYSETHEGSEHWSIEKYANGHDLESCVNILFLKTGFSRLDGQPV